MEKFLMNVFGLRNKDGDVQFTFPPKFTENKVISYLGYSEIKKIADVYNMEVVLVEMEVSFVETGVVRNLKSKPRGNQRPHYQQIHDEVQDMPEVGEGEQILRIST